MRRPLACAVAALALSGCGAQSNTGLAARVGGRVISSSRLGDDVAQVLALPQFRTADVNRGVVARTRLTTLIQRHLTDLAAQRLGVVVTDADARSRVAELADNFGSRAELEKVAEQNQTPRQDLDEALRAGLVRERVGLKLVEDVATSDADLRKAYDENKAQFDQVQLWQVQVRTEVDAATALRRAQAGEDFGAIAREMSIDVTSRDRGGFVDFIGRGVLDPVLEAAAFAPGAAGIAGPVKTSKGWHVLKIGKRRITAFADATDALRLILLQRQVQDRFRDYVGTLSRGLRITVSPRFGRWDADQASVQPPPDDLSSPPARPGDAIVPVPSPS